MSKPFYKSYTMMVNGALVLFALVAFWCEKPGAEWLFAAAMGNLGLRLKTDKPIHGVKK